VVEDVVRIRAATGRYQEAPADDLAKALAHQRRRKIDHGVEQCIVDPGPGGGRHPEDLLSGRRHRGDPGEHDIPKSSRKLAVAGLS
jgi:hypothetical protein